MQAFSQVKMAILPKGKLGLLYQENFIWPFRLKDVELSDSKKLKFSDEDKKNQAQLVRDQMVAMRVRKRGIKIKDIAERFNVTPRTIYAWLH